MTVHKKLTVAEFQNWLTGFRRTKLPLEAIGEHFIADNFPGHVDTRLTGVTSYKLLENVIVENYVIKDS